MLESLMPNYRRYPARMVKGVGARLFDETGRSYLDMTAGIAVTALGHAHPAVTKALAEQAGLLIHCSNLYEIPEQEAVADRLSRLNGGGQVFFCNSGAEANEAALKLARRYQYQRGESGRTEWVSLAAGFHGRTFGALSVTPRPAYHEGFSPLVSGCRVMDPENPDWSHIGPQTAAVIIECVQGEGGVRPLNLDFIQSLAQRARESGALVIIDEVQTGMGRTGTFFAWEQVGIQPDMVTMAKGLANGVPVGALIARPDVAQAFGPGSHGSTFGGNPLAMAAARVVIDTVSEPAFLAQVRTLGDILHLKLTQLCSNVPGGAFVRGRGLMQGLRMETAGLAEAVVAGAFDQGLLLTAVGDQTVRFVPPLVVTEAELDEADVILRRVLATVKA